MKELVLQLTHQSTSVVEPQAPVVEGRTKRAATPTAKEPSATKAEEEVLGGLVDIASLLGAPTMTVVRLSL
jgi:hypothetical protein